MGENKELREQFERSCAKTKRLWDEIRASDVWRELKSSEKESIALFFRLRDSRERGG